MSQENVEVVKAIHEHFSRGEYEAAFERIDEATEFLGSADISAGEGGWRGHEGVRQGMTRFLAAWEDYRLEVRNVVDCGEQVLVEAWQRASGRGSGVEITEWLYLLWTVRGGKATGLKTFRERDEALEAAGLSE